MKSLQAQFFFLLTTDALYCICIYQMHERISCFLQDMALSNNVNTSENKPNTSRKSKSVPFSIHGSQRGLGFHPCLECLCQLRAALHTGRLVIEKNKKVNFFYFKYMLFCCHSPPVKQANKIVPV